MAGRILSALFTLLVVVFLIGPVITILPLAFTSTTFLTYPIPEFSWRWFEELVASEAWRRSIVNSLIVGSAATLLSTVLGTMAALGLRGGLLPFSNGLRTLFLLPMVVPAVVLGVGAQILYGRWGLADTYLGVIVAHTVLCLPFVIVNVTAALGSINPTVERAAGSLGAGPLRTFRYVTFPLALPGITSGAVFAFATSLDEVVITLFVAGPNQRTLARQMFSSIRENISPTVVSAAFILIVGTICLAVLAWVLRRRRTASGLPARAAPPAPT